MKDENVTLAGQRASAYLNRCVLSCFAATLLANVILADSAQAQSQAAAAADSLASEFANPPPSARPRVWWHWMNGNVTKDGIVKDLEWMKRVGIGGLQNFDANLTTPQIVPQRLVYMTPEWKDAFRFAAQTADRLDLEMAIAASPGWSETGGPWVKAEDGMKKLVWSEIEVSGAKRTSIKLPAPPNASGPFLDLGTGSDILAGATGNKPFVPPVHYGDIAVLAYPVPAAAKLPTPRVSWNGQALDVSALIDDKLTTAVEVGSASAERPVVLSIDFDEPQTVSSARLFFDGATPSIGGHGGVPPHLEASDDGKQWRKLADIALSTVPTTVSFAPTAARAFRVVFAVPPKLAPPFNPVAGADPSALAAIFKPPASLKIAQLQLFGEAKINMFEAKAGFSISDDYYSLDANVGPDRNGVALKDVIDLTARMKADGTLDWTPPKGNWRIVRLGYSLTGKTNHPASAEATGLEVDKYDANAVRDYMEEYLGMYKDTVGAGFMGERGVRALLTDSIEVGASNWTPKLIEQFKTRRGYDPTPYLPALVGTIVGSRRESDAFLYDFRRTLTELIASEHYGTVAKVAHEHGLKVYGESLEGFRPTLGDDIDMRRYADYPMAALWTFGRETGASSSYRADMKGAASTANLYGQKIVAAESMTSALAPWGHAPADLRRVIDLEFVTGINRPVIHTSVHQPVDDKQPGLSLLVFGQYFTRHETWAEMAKPWVDYLSRNSYMLQQGRTVADVAYFYGEDASWIQHSYQAFSKQLPTRYNYDLINAEAILNLLRVEGGEVTAPSGARYRVIYLGGTSEKMTLPVLRRLAALAEGGATVVGTAPNGSPSLKDEAAEYAALVKKLWSGSATTQVGRGRVIANTDVEAVLASLGVPPDFSYDKPASDSEVLFLHRKLDDGDVYFVNNRVNRAERIEARFRVTGKAPQLWRADTGGVEPLSYRIDNGVTIVSLEMTAEDSFFVVFRKPTTQTSATFAKTNHEPLLTIEGDWNVSFQPGRGAPGGVKLASLASLSEHSDPGIKYFSGIATYTKRFALPKGVKRGQSVMLDLGNIGDVAEVRVNGQLIGTVWHAPYQLDIGKSVRAGANELEVKVANLWANRLIGDAQPNTKKVAFTTVPTYRPDAPLRPSGLIGPVRLLAP
ncbi:glycosyl hydrolase [Steroidobacter flavus]|uniref:Glycosyl hydrolase n=1 Tax=Steroidobacter flavus TaxID=1842136 RepID=A0ABV8SWL4_9GAMM